MTLDEKEQIKQQNTETVNEKNPTVFSSEAEQLFETFRAAETEITKQTKSNGCGLSGSFRKQRLSEIEQPDFRIFRKYPKISRKEKQ